MSKNKLILILIVTITIFVLIILYSLNKNSNKTSQTGEKFQQKINLVNPFPNKTFLITNNLKSSNFDFPNQLPYLSKSISPDFNENKLNEIANNLNFTNNPIVFNDTENGNVTIWNSDDFSLVYTQKTHNLRLSSYKTLRLVLPYTSDRDLPDEETQQIATNFLSQKILMNPSNLNFAGYSYFKIKEGAENVVKTTKDEAEIIQLNYFENVSRFPIYTVDPEQPQIAVQILKDGNVYGLNALLGYQFSNSLIEYPIKSYSETINDLDKGIIVSLDDNNIIFEDLKTDQIQNINVNNIKLVYLLENLQNNKLQPVFLITGKANIVGINPEANISFYLPAFKRLDQP